MTDDTPGKIIDVAIDRLEEALDVLHVLRGDAPDGLNRIGEAATRLLPEAHKLMYAMVKANADSVFEPPPEPSEKRVCPACDYKFRGKGWEGIDAHWRSKHEDIMLYEDAWPLLRDGTYAR